MEIWGQKPQPRCLSNAEMYCYFFILQIFKIKLACQDGDHRSEQHKITKKISSRCIFISFRRDLSTFWN